MSTNASVHVKGTDGKVRSIYIHWDGYLSGVGHMLRDHYSNQAAADELVGMGDCSSLESSLEDSTFYHRDRNEDYDDVRPNEAFNLVDSLELNSQSYDYYFDTAQWHVVSDGHCMSLSEAKEAEAEEE